VTPPAAATVTSAPGAVVYARWGAARFWRVLVLIPPSESIHRQIKVPQILIAEFGA
jgi:hypothetical protein